MAGAQATPDISPMASALTDKLTRLVKEMRGQARITESNVQDMLREVRMALLEADVALPVVRDFIARAKEKALGNEVLLSLTPGQALIDVVHQELTTLMGAQAAPLGSCTSTRTPGIGLPSEPGLTTKSGAPG